MRKIRSFLKKVPLLRRVNHLLLKVKQGFIYQRQDIVNWYKYGANAPLACELIYVQPAKINKMMNLKTYQVGRANTGQVLDGDWDLDTSEFIKLDKYQACFEHFCLGKTWEEAGAYDLMKRLIKQRPGADGCYSFPDIKERYRKLDDIYSFISVRGFKSNHEITKYNYRNYGGIYIHINRHGEPVFGLGGCHRLSIAKILELKEIPAQLGVVHKDAIEIWQEKIRRLDKPRNLKHWFNF